MILPLSPVLVAQDGEDLFSTGLRNNRRAEEEMPQVMSACCHTHIFPLSFAPDPFPPCTYSRVGSFAPAHGACYPIPRYARSLPTPHPAATSVSPLPAHDSFHNSLLLLFHPTPMLTLPLLFASALYSPPKASVLICPAPLARLAFPPLSCPHHYSAPLL